MRYAWFPVLAGCSCAYFYYHAIEGRFGLEQSALYDTKITALTAELDVLSAEHEKLEARTSALRNGTLERDMIDEQARRMLGLSRANELVLLHSTN